MKTKTRIHSVLAGFLPLATIMLAGSCTVHEQEYPDGNSIGVSDAPVVIRASESLLGRGTRVGEAQSVKERDMLFTYPSFPLGEMKSALCKFDEKGYGYVYADNTGDREALKWRDIYTDNPKGYGVYLDNLLDYPVQVANKGSDPTTGKPDPLKYYDNFEYLYFGPGESKKNEKVMVAEAGSDEARDGIDIVWGKIAKAETGKSLHFQLDHMMSQLTFRFYSENKELQEALETDKNITVTLIGVQRSLTRYPGNQLNPPLYTLPPFRRRDGYIEATGRNEPDSITFADNGLTKTTETIGTATYCASKTMVLPPFEITGNYKIPQLKITIEGQDYIGALPNKIDYTLSNGTSAQLARLKFMSGYHTVFNVKLINEWGKKEILFQNVKVDDWIRAYEDEVDLSESGINTWEDLEALAAVFNEDHSKNNYRLMKYGTWNETEWEFILWKDIEVSGDLTLPKFNTGNFGIDVNEKKIKWGETEIATEEDFKKYFVENQ